MRFLSKSSLLLGAMLCGVTASAIPANLKENYQPIVDRNPFGLKPPPPPPTNAPVAAPVVEKPKVEIFLTGITSIGYPRLPKKVFLKTQEQNKKEPAFYELAEGVEKEGIKVLSIDDVNRRVRIMTDGGETVLSFQTHGVAPPASPAMPMPGQPGAMPMPGQPGAMPGQVPPLPGGQPSFPGAQPQPAMLNNTVAPVNNAQGNFRSIPSRSIRSRIPNADYAAPGQMPGNNTVPVPGQAQPQQQAMPDPAEQYLRMHLDKAQKERQGIPMPPLPQ